MMGLRAARAALRQAEMDAAEIELIVVATCTPEYMFPSTACQIQGELGASRAAAFDMSAACSGFVYALHVASQAVRSGSARAALVIGTERMSRVLDWRDRSTCILFGDGAGAVVLKGVDEPGGILSSVLGADGTRGEILTLPVAYNSPDLWGDEEPLGPTRNAIAMNGPQVFRFATEVLVEAVIRVVGMGGLSLEEIDLIVPHQANTRIVEMAARRLELPLDRFFLNVRDTANTSAASIPLALCEAQGTGRLRPESHIVLVGFGGGLTWGAALVRWEVVAPPTQWAWPASLPQERRAPVLA
jgi:3-oxoacyl-[acyl-carrier-protein] synthase-3